MTWLNTLTVLSALAYVIFFSIGPGLLLYIYTGVGSYLMKFETKFPKIIFKYKFGRDPMAHHIRAIR